MGSVWGAPRAKDREGKRVRCCCLPACRRTKPRRRGSAADRPTTGQSPGTLRTCRFRRLTATACRSQAPRALRAPLPQTDGAKPAPKESGSRLNSSKDGFSLHVLKTSVLRLDSCSSSCLPAGSPPLPRGVLAFSQTQPARPLPQHPTSLKAALAGRGGAARAARRLLLHVLPKKWW